MCEICLTKEIKFQEKNMGRQEYTLGTNVRVGIRSFLPCFVCVLLCVPRISALKELSMQMPNKMSVFHQSHLHQQGRAKLYCGNIQPPNLSGLKEPHFIPRQLALCVHHGLADDPALYHPAFGAKVIGPSPPGPLPGSSAQGK